MDGGIVVPDGGDGIQRYPADKSGAPVDPDMDAGDRARIGMGLEPEGEGEAPPEDDKDEFDDDKEFYMKKGRKNE